MLFFPFWTHYTCFSCLQLLSKGLYIHLFIFTCFIHSGLIKNTAFIFPACISHCLYFFPCLFSPSSSPHQPRLMSGASSLNQRNKYPGNLFTTLAFKRQTCVGSQGIAALRRRVRERSSHFPVLLALFPTVLCQDEEKKRRQCYPETSDGRSSDVKRRPCVCSLSIDALRARERGRDTEGWILCLCSSCSWGRYATVKRRITAAELAMYCDVEGEETRKKN